MRTKRVKKANKTLNFFHFNYKYEPPYLILLDGTFCQAALENKINLREQMPKYLSAEIEMLVTKCVLNELEQLGTEVYGAFSIARQFSIAKCPHKPLRPACECILHLARRSKSAEKHRAKYFVATQDDDLLEKLRVLSGIPLLSIRWNAIFLEKPSNEAIQNLPQASHELEKVRQLKTEVFGSSNLKRKKK